MDQPTPPAEATSPAPPPAKIPEWEMWRLSHINLEMRYAEQGEEILELRRELIQRDKAAIVQRKQVEVDRLHTTYGLDPDKHRIMSDGSILPVDHPLLQQQNGRRRT